MASSKIVVNVPPELKTTAMSLYEQMGMSLSTAVNVFLAQSVHDGGMPFTPTMNDGLTQLRRARLNPHSTAIKEPEIRNGAAMLNADEYDPAEDVYDSQA